MPNSDTPAATVNDTRVRQIISVEIGRARAQVGRPGCDSIHLAWRNLKAWRDERPAPGATPNSLDIDRAAAENYMFARWSVCAGNVSPFQMKTMAVGYYLSKVIGMKMPTSNNPQAEPSWAVMRWGQTGATEGAIDRAQYNPGANPPLWRPMNEIFGKDLGWTGRRSY